MDRATDVRAAVLFALWEAGFDGAHAYSLDGRLKVAADPAEGREREEWAVQAGPHPEQNEIEDVLRDFRVKGWVEPREGGGGLFVLSAEGRMVVELMRRWWSRGHLQAMGAYEAERRKLNERLEELEMNLEAANDH